MKKQLKALFQQCYHVIQENWIEFLLFFIAFVYTWFRYMQQPDAINQHVMDTIRWLIPTVTISHGFKRLASLQSAPRLYLWGALGSSIGYTLLFIFLLSTKAEKLIIVSTLPLWPILYGHRQNSTYLKGNIQLLSSLVFTPVLAGAATGLLVLLYHAIITLFQLPSSEIVRVTLGLLGGLIISPLLFFHFLNETSKSGKSSSFLRILSTYIIKPSIIAFTMIIYGYGLKILLQWELPEGYITKIASSYLVLFLLGKALFEKAHHGKSDFLFDHFSALCLGPLVLLWVGFMRRVLDYGLTEARVILLGGCLLISLAVLLFTHKQYGRYLYLAIANFAVIFALIYIPWSSPVYVSLKSQSYIAQREALQLGILTPMGEINLAALLDPNTSINASEAQTLSSALQEIKKYTQAKNNFYKNWLRQKAQDELTQLGIDDLKDLQHIPKKTNSNAIQTHRFTNEIIELKGYDKAVIPEYKSQPDSKTSRTYSYYYHEKTGILDLFQQDNVLTSISLNDQHDKNNLYEVTDPKCKVIFKRYQIQRKHDTLRILNPTIELLLIP